MLNVRFQVSHRPALSHLVLLSHSCFLWLFFDGFWLAVEARPQSPVTSDPQHYHISRRDFAPVQKTYVRAYVFTDDRDHQSKTKKHVWSSLEFTMA